MDVDNELSNIRNHGESVDNNRVKCKYCAKTMTTFSRLKNHLGGVGTDVTSCEMVPEDVKEVFWKMLLEKDASGKKSGGNSLTGLPVKRNFPRNSNEVKRSKPGTSQAAGSSSGNSDVMVSAVEGETTEGNSEGYQRTCIVELEKSIGRFFSETGVHFSVASSPSFQMMISAAVGTSKLNCKIPASQELQEQSLRDETLKMHEYIGETRDSWAITGCSLLLDGWVGKTGRQFVTFIVECPKGPIYVSSADVSANDLDYLQGLLDGTIKRIGIDNLVQIVASSSTGWMAALQDRFMQQSTSVIWSISVSHCIKLMLDRISSLVPIKRALDGAKAIATFLYSHGDVLQFMKFHTDGKDLVDPSWMEFAVPFFTLERVTLEKKNLEKMFGSYKWQMSLWARTNEGKRAADLMNDLSFWAAADDAMDSTFPLLKVYDIVTQTDKPFVGYIYETIDQAKETIKEELKGTKLRYQPVWDIIDDVWNNQLHNILHGAAYYLNPIIYYSEDFYQDEEIYVGLFCCIVRLVTDKRVEVLITSQLDKYRTRQGPFEEGSTSQKLKNVTPVEWWSIYGNHCPELQSFAIRILSQTCDGASRYKLDRTVAEKSITDASPAEEERLAHLAAMHYNLQFQKYKTNSTITKIKTEQTD